MADTFIEKVTKDAIKLAKHRGSSTLDVVDMALALKKGYGMSVDGLDMSIMGNSSGSGEGGGGAVGSSGWLLNERGVNGGGGNGGGEPSQKKMKVGGNAATAAAM